MTIDSAEMLGIAVYTQRRKLKLNQQKVADLAKLKRTVVSQLERGHGGTAHFRVVLLLVNALGMDIELRPRNWTPTGTVPLDPATSLAELDLGRAALACLKDAGIREIGQLGDADELIQLPQFSKGNELYQIVCALNRQGLSLPANRRRRLPGDREREMFHLRVVKGLTLKEIGERAGVKSERARQLLNYYFGLKGTPPAAKERKHAATARRRVMELEAAQAVRTDLIAGWRTGQPPRDLAGLFDVPVASIQEVIDTTATDADREARARALRNQRHRKGRWPTR